MQLGAWQRKCQVLLASLHRYPACPDSLYCGTSMCGCQQAASMMLYASATFKQQCNVTTLKALRQAAWNMPQDVHNMPASG